MPSGYTTGFEDRLLYDVARLYYRKKGGDGNKTLMGVTRGGLTFRPNTELRQAEFDGRRSPIAGNDRKVDIAAVISGTMILEVPKHIVLLEPGITSALAGNITTWTPKPASTVYDDSDDYIVDLEMVARKADLSWWTVLFERALCTEFEWVGPDKDEQTVQVTFAARLKQTDAATSTDTVPYVFKEYPSNEYPS